MAKSMDMEFTYGRTTLNFRAFTNRISNTERASLRATTVKYLRVSGIGVKGMVKELSFIRTKSTTMTGKMDMLHPKRGKYELSF